MVITFYLTSVVAFLASYSKRARGGRRGTGCVFLFVNSNVNFGRIVTIRSCLSCGTNGINNRELAVARFPCSKMIAACSTGGGIASSSTTKATVTKNRGAGGRCLKIGTVRRPIAAVTGALGRRKCGVNVASSITMGRTAPTTFCTRSASECGCCKVKRRLTRDKFRFFTNSNFLSCFGGSNRGVRSCLGKGRCPVCCKVSRCQGSTNTSDYSEIVLYRRDGHKNVTSGCRDDDGVPKSSCLGSILHANVRFLKRRRPFFVVYRNKGVS